MAVQKELSPGIVVLSAVVGGISLATGTLLTVTSLFGYAAGPWVSPEALSPGLVGAAMAGVAPALFTIGRARLWEDVRSLVLPLVIVLAGLFAVSLLNGGSLQAAEGGPLFLALFSLGWVATLGLLALGAVGCLVAQYRRPAGGAGAAPRHPVAPLPGWSKPPLAVVGSGWLGIGAGLLAFPDFWGALLPWTVNRADAQGLGVWALALGVGVLGALAEDDLTRIRPALRAVPLIALAAAVVLAVHHRSVDWTSGPGASLLALVTGLFTTGASGHWLLSRADRRIAAAREAGPATPAGSAVAPDTPAASESEAGPATPAGSAPEAPLAAGPAARPSPADDDV
ncbi:hypothetical protein J3A78_001048 [Streptomyces sp. PvR006]|uniref:hypothetical protein n=1 Tax=Streptomyces sp. PvR006 TaxID=2817860 RepID=UPI001AE3FEE9|nr:hypothetical protein [Streptomyces sp. PvR006]MBP2580570.1 hypothetical protein [Streptomyces sp. PvR006]